MTNEADADLEPIDPFKAMRGMVGDFERAEVDLEFAAAKQAESEERLATAEDALAKMLLDNPATSPLEHEDFSRGIVIDGTCYFATTDSRDRRIVHRVRIAWTAG